LDEILRVEDRYYILSTSSLADDRVRVLKHGDTFAVFDRRGDIETLGAGVQGVYHEETRHLSQWVLRLGATRPLLLSSGVSNDNASLAVDLTNPDLYQDGQVVVPRGTLHIARSKFLWDGTHYEKLRLVNYSLSPLETSVIFQFVGDFADIFEARGMHRKHRGERLPDSSDHDEAMLSYRGLDGIVRRTVVRCSPKPQRMSNSEIHLDISLLPKAQQTYTLTASCEHGSRQARVSIYDIAAAEAVHALRDARERALGIYTANEQFNDWLNRSAVDLQMMITNTHHGLYPYAGVPWFSTVFGRDGIITALEMLWVNPAVSRGVLSYLADNQATAEDPEADAQPGKILHEVRKGEMAAVKEVPFKCYYGSVDSTPLFVMLAGAYYRRTADLTFVKQIWPNIEAALAWVDHYGDPDQDGFVEFQRQSANGLVQQGWKDSYDSVSHSDGTLAEGPFALCEVQGYVYAAKREAAGIALALGNAPLADQLREQARALRQKFEQAYWCEDLSTYALALDGEKRPCRVRASNAGHCLYTGIATVEHARRTAQTLLGRDFFTGWGIRTLSAREVRYNAMSYHNGSVWPHDNALIARGFCRYGLRRSALKILTGLLDASLFFDLHRLPELFCGFDREPGQAPTLYPVACSPQSWAAGAVFMILESCLGIRLQASPPRVTFRRTVLPASLPRVELKNLSLGGATADLAVEKEDDGFYVRMLRKQGSLDIISVK
jgi:glycogen debranching enzyme